MRMTRPLVCRSEFARHRFRQMLPPHVLRVEPVVSRAPLLNDLLKTWLACTSATLIFLL